MMLSLLSKHAYSDSSRVLREAVYAALRGGRISLLFDIDKFVLTIGRGAYRHISKSVNRDFNHEAISGHYSTDELAGLEISP